MQSRPSYDGRTYVPPKIKRWKFRMMRDELIAKGHYFPVFPMRDRMLDVMPKVKKHILEKEQRYIFIINNLKILISSLQHVQCTLSPFSFLFLYRVEAPFFLRAVEPLYGGQACACTIVCVLTVRLSSKLSIQILISSSVEYFWEKNYFSVLNRDEY